MILVAAVGRRVKKSCLWQVFSQSRGATRELRSGSDRIENRRSRFGITNVIRKMKSCKSHAKATKKAQDKLVLDLVAAVGYRIKEWNDVNCRVDCETRRGPDYTSGFATTKLSCRQGLKSLP